MYDTSVREEVDNWNRNLLIRSHEHTALSFNFDITIQIFDCVIVILLLTSDFNICVVSDEGTNNC